MSFEERLSRFIKLYEDMEKKVAQDDLYNKEFTVSCITSHTPHYNVANASNTLTDAQVTIIAMEK